VLPDEFQGLPVFPVLVPVLCKESLDNPASPVTGTISTGIHFLFHEAAAFHGTSGGLNITFTVIVSQLAALAGRHHNNR